jgi:hypothetical protein
MSSRRERNTRSASAQLARLSAGSKRAIGT